LFLTSKILTNRALVTFYNIRSRVHTLNIFQGKTIAAGGPINYPIEKKIEVFQYPELQLVDS